MGNTNKIKNRTAEVEELMGAKRENPFLCFSPWVGRGRLTELSMLVERRLAVMMMAAGVRCVSTGTVEAAERRRGQGQRSS